MQTYIRRAAGHSLEGYPDWIASLLHARGVSTAAEAERFLHPALDQLHDPLLMRGMAEALQLIRGLAARRARAVVYGDYDVDGLCASVIMHEALRAEGLRPIIYIPDRHSEGYGLSADAIRHLAPQAELLVSVDCGVTAREEAALARQLGLRVIITDHHQPPDELPDADALINPLLGGYPFPGLCGAGTAWKLSSALRGLDFARRQLDLAALATIADMVPLVGENRVLAALGLEALRRTARPGLTALMEAMGLQAGQPLSSERVSFGLAPRLNAGGRLTTAQDALRLLQSQHPGEARELALSLNDLNAQRQAQERQVLSEAEEQLRAFDLLRRQSIVLAGAGWNSGVVGLAAGRLAEKYGYPSIVLSQEGDGLRGSGRSAGDVDLYAALKACEGLFTRFGGHRQAAGLALPLGRLDEFRAAFERAVRAQLDGRRLLPQVSYDAPIGIGDASLENIQALEKLQPFGVGNPAPAFLLRDVEVAASRAVGAEGRHLKLSLRQEGDMLDAIGFGMGGRQRALPPTLDAVVRLSLNAFQGRVSPQAQVAAMRAGSRAFQGDQQAERLALLQDMQAFASNVSQAPALVAPALAVEGLTGTLLICRTADTAERMHARYPDFDCATGAYSDPLGHNAVLYRVPLTAIEAPCEAIVFCDGLADGAEAALAARLFPGAGLSAAPRSAGLQALLDALRLDAQLMRDYYRHLRGGLPGDPPAWPQGRARAAALVLEQLGLIRFVDRQPVLNPMKRTDLTQSSLYRLLS